MIAPTILDRLLDPVTDLSAQAAKEIVDLQLDPALQARLEELAELANRGQLTAEDREQYEQYLDGIDLLGVLKTKARAALRKAGSVGCA